MNPKIKNIIIFAGIFILLVVGYVVFFKKDNTQTPALVTTSGVAGSSTQSTVAGGDVGREFLTTLLNLQNIKLDDSIFTNTAFLNLKDFELTLIQETNPGRTNPFLPLGTDTTATSTTTSVGTTTITPLPPASPIPTTNGSNTTPTTPTPTNQ